MKLWLLGILLVVAGCAPRLAYPPRDLSTLDACMHDCSEIARTCQGKTCEDDRKKCIQRCRDYGGLRGGGNVTLQVP